MHRLCSVQSCKCSASKGKIGQALRRCFALLWRGETLLGSFSDFAVVTICPVPTGRLMRYFLASLLNEQSCPQGPGDGSRSTSTCQRKYMQVAKDYENAAKSFGAYGFPAICITIALLHARASIRLSERTKRCAPVLGGISEVGKVRP